MFTAIANAISDICKPVSSAGNALNESLEMATGRIHRRAVADKNVDKFNVQLSTAKALREVQAELNSDEELAKIFADLEKEFA